MRFRLPCCPPILPWQVPMLRVLRNNWAGVCIQILLTAWCAPLLRCDEARGSTRAAPPFTTSMLWARQHVRLLAGMQWVRLQHYHQLWALPYMQADLLVMARHLLAAQPAAEGGHGDARVAGAVAGC